MIELLWNCFAPMRREAKRVEKKALIGIDKNFTMIRVYRFVEAICNRFPRCRRDIAWPMAVVLEPYGITWLVFKPTFTIASCNSEKNTEAWSIIIGRIYLHAISTWNFWKKKLQSIVMRSLRASDFLFPPSFKLTRSYRE